MVSLARLGDDDSLEKLLNGLLAMQRRGSPVSSWHCEPIYDPLQRKLTTPERPLLGS
jgi:hypothetical protein